MSAQHNDSSDLQTADSGQIFSLQCYVPKYSWQVILLTINIKNALPACTVCILTKGTTSVARGESLRPRSELDELIIKTLSMNSSIQYHFKNIRLHVQSLIVVLGSFTRSHQYRRRRSRAR